VGMRILWGYPQDFLWVWDWDRNSVHTAALLLLPVVVVYVATTLVNKAQTLLALTFMTDHSVSTMIIE